MDESEPISPHEQKEQEKAQKQVAKELAQREEEKRKQTQKLAKQGFIALLVLAVITYIIFSIKTPEPYVNREIHWHATIELELCDKHVDLPRISVGQHHKGLPLLHTHDDNTIHVEGGPIQNAEDISLGEFMDAIGVDFDKARIMNYKTGDNCPNSTTPGKLTMYLNDKETDSFRNYITKNGDKIKITFK